MAARKKPQTGTALERPRVLTPDVCNTILQLVAAGNYQKVALKAAGVTQQALNYWQQRARSGDPGVPAAILDFFVQLERASSIGEARALDRVLNDPANSPGNRWFLERKFPQRWAKPSERPASADTADRREVVEEAQRRAEELRAAREAEEREAGRADAEGVEGAS
ncbi:hypothetical protein [Aquisphaera insulae]|uniref:hypothetical protein n=1 Tax=Aquisphaera insulae TaxID=2712864 RepID=UPI0013EDBB1A|nr:hypothetical protein [Aquisphaera insulae]